MRSTFRTILLAAAAAGAAAAPADTATPRLDGAREHWQAFRIDEARAAFEHVLADQPSAANAAAFADFLLAMRFTDHAETVLDQALAESPVDPRLLTLRAALAAARDRDEIAVAYLDEARAAGAPPLAWLDQPVLAARAHLSPYCTLLDADELAGSLEGLGREALIQRLRLLAPVITAQSAAAVVSVLDPGDDGEVIRSALFALRALGPEVAPLLNSLLANPSPRVRRGALLEVRRLRLPGLVPLLEQHLSAETDPRNLDLAEVVLAELRAAAVAPDEAVALLHLVGRANSFRHLAVAAEADIEARRGRFDRARALRAQARDLRWAVKSTGDIKGYWECMERLDLIEIAELTYHHNYVEPIDATVYGLPTDDLDDKRALSIAERLFLRSWFSDRGEALPTSGPVQYPREARHILRQIQRESGTLVDCSGFLVADPAEAMGEDGGEVKVHEDTGVDNEVNIVVNPYDQRHLVATSNDYGGAGGNDLYRPSDWGKTWTTGDVPASSACDPVSYYTRTDTPTGLRDVVYHSYLFGPNVKYSTDNGATWGSCAAVSSGNDRQDMAIDSNPASACYNTIYVSYDYMSGGNQARVSSSTGATFPYCQSWSEHSTGVSGTIGMALVVSTNGAAHNLFTQYGTPGGVYMTSSSSCGASWSPATKVLDINNAGDFEWPIPSTCTRQVYYYPQADSDRQPTSEHLNNIYVVWNDLSSQCTPPGCDGNTTCNNDIFFGVGVPDDRSDPSSWTWSSYNLTELFSDAYTDEFYPSLTVDQADGAIYVSYYRSDSGAGGNLTARKTRVHYVMVRSLDAGLTWQGPYQITDLPTDESGSGANLGMQWGDYTWNDVINGVAYPAWTDRREVADEDIWAAKVCTEPSHWSERAPTFTPAQTAATAIGSRQIEVSWELPDLYWGDGGENPAARSFQLWVDGELEQDSVPATTTSTLYEAVDCSTPHTFVVRAVNQCGVSKDYASATTVATGCCENNPTVDVTPDGPLTLCAGTAQTLQAELTGGVGPFDLQWYRDGSPIPGATTSTHVANDLGTHAYNCRVVGDGCSDWARDPYDTSVTWQAEPTFAGLESVTGPGLATCTLELAWSEVSSACPGPFTYSVYRSTTPGFEPGDANRVAEGLTGTGFTDTTGLVSGTSYHYIVRAVDASNGVEDRNTVEHGAAPTGPVTIGAWTDDAGDTGPATLALEAPWSAAASGGHNGPGVYQTGDYGNNTCAGAATPTLHLGADAQLSFWSRFDIETGWDKGEVQLSTDGGASWQRVPIDYPGSSTYTSDACSLPTGTYFTGTDLTWREYGAGLGAWAGEDVVIRWLMSSDTSVTDSGWWVDDIEISNVEVPGTCVTQSEPPLFADGFESGNTTQWGRTLP